MKSPNASPDKEDLEKTNLKLPLQTRKKKLRTKSQPLTSRPSVSQEDLVARPTMRTLIKIRQSKRTRSRPAAQHVLNQLCVEVTKTTMMHLITLISLHHLHVVAEVANVRNRSAYASRSIARAKRNNTPHMPQNVHTGPNTKNLWLLSGATSARKSISLWRLRFQACQRLSAKSLTILITTRTKLRLTRKSTIFTKS